MIASDAGETHDGIRLWICYSWHVHIWKILSKDPKMQRFKALSFLVTFLPAVSKMAEFFSFPSSFRQSRTSPERVSVCVLWFPTWEHNCILKGINRYIQMKCLKSRTGQCESWWVSGSHLLHIQVLWASEHRAVPSSSCLPFSVFLLTWPGKDERCEKALSAGSEATLGLLSWWQKQHDKEMSRWVRAWWVWVWGSVIPLTVCFSKLLRASLSPLQNEIVVVENCTPRKL